MNVQKKSAESSGGEKCEKKSSGGELTALRRTTNAAINLILDIPVLGLAAYAAWNGTTPNDAFARGGALIMGIFAASKAINKLDKWSRGSKDH